MAEIQAVDAIEGTPAPTTPAPSISLVPSVAPATPAPSSFEPFADFLVTSDFANPLDTTQHFVARITDEVAIADDAAALVDHLDSLLTFGGASEETKTKIIGVLEEFPLADPNDPNDGARLLRARLGILMLMTSPDYLIQR